MADATDSVAAGTPALTIDLLRHAYRHGLFPMAASATSAEIDWYLPSVRSVIPLDRYKIPARLRRWLHSQPYQITLNQNFAAVIQSCGNIRPQRSSTWINQEIITAYTALHHAGDAHSIEVWDNQQLVGGLYGVAMGAAFFGESMFSVAPNTSKLALVALIGVLRSSGYLLLDCQLPNPHLQQFGAIEITAQQFAAQLALALAQQAQLPAPGALAAGIVAGAVAAVGAAGTSVGVRSF